MPSSRKRFGLGLVALAVASSGVSVLAAPAQANPAGTGLVINEAYLNGGSASAVYTNKFVEIYNPTDSPISLSGLSLQYRAPTGTASASGVAALTGTLAAKGYYVVTGGSNGSVGTAVPNSNQTATGINPGAGGGTLFIANGTSATTPTGAVDTLGWGTSNAPEGTAASGNTVALSLQRDAAGKDTDANSADFAAVAPTPGAARSGGGTTPTDPPPAGTVTPIAQIQGTDTATSPQSGRTVTAQGVVTASYPTGGFTGYYIQTGGTGGATDATPGASDAIFVYSPGLAAASYPALGTTVEVTGAVSEFNGTTEITSNAVTTASTAQPAVTPLAAAYPTTEAAREAHEGELLAPTDTFTVSNTYSTNQYATIGLATGDKPLVQPTEVADAQDAAAVANVVADNAKRGVVLDDGASTNFLGSTANKAIALPWLTKTKAVSVGARATLASPVVLEYRNGGWNFQPRQQVTGDGSSVATFSDVRAQNATPDVQGGDLKLATFNVLNYFTTTAQAVGCTSVYNDREGNPITANTCPDPGPRGAANDVNLQRQQAKIVTAINAMGADIVSLEEIENSVKFGKDRDDALSKLVAALNAATGTSTWDYVRSPSAGDLPATSAQDVIRTAFIYKPAKTAPVGVSKVLLNSTFDGSARQPLAQAFKKVGAADSSAFAVVVNHFKSKGSGPDDGTGQGNSNQARIDQANALVSFVNGFTSERGISKVFLAGDFNAYSQEDPMQVLYQAGYTDLRSKFDPATATYSFSGLAGSLDHVLANDAALGDVTDADVWSINSGESIAYEYSRYNYNATDFYTADQFRASDHDPLVVGLASASVPATPVKLNLLNINDFHGRIDTNTTRFATTIENLRAADGASGANTLFLSDGDNIGASVFASSVEKDKPTLDVLNALGLQASAVGNHEFDLGFSDLTDRVQPASSWKFLGANVYKKGTQTPALPEYDVLTINGVKVGVIGAVTQETPSLVSPGGIADLDFGDPVEAVNRVAAQLKDGNPANGEADVIVAEYHEGAGANLPDTATCAQEIAADTAFGRIARQTVASVDAIFTGHTHKTYACAGPVPGSSTRTRPIVQTGSYGENIGQVELTLDGATKAVTAYTQKNVARSTTENLSYPRVQRVKEITDAALANAAAKGNVQVGSVTADITTAYSGGSSTTGTYTGGTRDDRANESTLGDLVANAFRDGIPSSLGKADIGIVNPGGLRAELAFKGTTTTDVDKDGVVTYGEANAVLPFANNMWLVKLTGAQLKQVLEQQYQTNANGTVPSRPYLQLGLSDNVRVTSDPSLAAGSRITSVRIDDQPLDPAKTYTVSTVSFLKDGGDNFRAFTQGTGTDTALVDRDLWIKYLQDRPGLSPDFARQQVDAPGLPQAVTAGQQVSFTLNKLNLTSQGSPANTQVTVFLSNGTASRRIGSFAVTNGSASVSFTAPANLSGSFQVGVVATPSGTQVGVGGAVPTPAAVSGTVSSASGPVAGACVYLYTSRTAAAASYASCTATNGTYTIADVDPGTYEVAVADPSGTYATQFRAAPITVTAAGLTGIDATLAPISTGAIAGTVTEAGSGTTLGSVCVFAYPRGTTTSAKYATCTDSSGAYYLGNVDAGTYDVAFFDQTGTHTTQWFTGTTGGATTQTGAAPLTVSARTTATANAALSKVTTGSVSGSLTTPANGPASGVCVYLYSTTVGASGPASYGTCSAADGTYYLGNVAAGSYKVGIADTSSGRYQTQWYTGQAGGSATYAGGSTITVAAGQSVTGISAQLTAVPAGTTARSLSGADQAAAQAEATEQAQLVAAAPTTGPAATKVATSKAKTSKKAKAKAKAKKKAKAKRKAGARR